mmetsp:Transcript_3339/g.8646  ORF Transcript_3339/g.8646 Transcript_3339/m.8646 type:complete len:454 (+) Transcript_3339:65-1426(+)
MSNYLHSEADNQSPLWLSGPSGSGKISCLTAMKAEVESSSCRVLHVDCVESPSDRSLMQAIREELQLIRRSPVGDEDSLDEPSGLYASIVKNFESIEEDTLPAIILVVSCAERLLYSSSKSTFSTALPVLFQAPRITARRLVPVFVSRGPWNAIAAANMQSGVRTRGTRTSLNVTTSAAEAICASLPEPRQVYFEPYTKKVAEQIIKRALLADSLEGEETRAIEKKVSEFTSVLMGVAYELYGGDIRELIRIAWMAFPPCLKLASKLTNMQKYEKTVHAINEVLIEKPGFSERVADDIYFESSLLPQLTDIEKYILLASYLASKNATRHDLKLFTGFTRKRKRAQRDRNPSTNAKSDARAASKQQKLPREARSRIFSLERLLAIADALKQGGLQQRGLREVVSLVSRGLLVRTSQDIVEPRFRAAVSDETAKALGAALGIVVSMYMAEADVED